MGYTPTRYPSFCSEPGYRGTPSFWSEPRGPCPCAPSVQTPSLSPPRHHRLLNSRITSCPKPSPFSTPEACSDASPAPSRRPSAAPSARRPRALPGPWSTAGRRWTRRGRRRRARARPWTSTRPRTSPISPSPPTSPTAWTSPPQASAPPAPTASSSSTWPRPATCSPPGPPSARESLDRKIQLELAAVGASFQLDVARFVCNPLSGHLFRLPVPAMGAARTSTVFGLLTQSDGPHCAPDRFAVAQLSCRAADNRIVLRRFLSETGEWDERELLVPSMWPGWQQMQVDTNHTVLAFGDRLWWVDVTWGAFSVDPFSDRPDVRFVELPRGVLSDFDTSENLMLGKRRLMGVSEGKLRYIEVSTEKEFVVSSFSLDGEGCCWKPTRETTVKLVLPNKRKPLEKDMPWIAAVDPFDADVLYYQSGHDVIAMDMAKGEVIGKRAFPDSITGLSPCNTAFFLPCVLPTWLESSHVPGAGALLRKTPNCTRKTLADTLVRVDEDQKK